MQEVESVSTWLLETNIHKLATVLSGIWFSRNKKVWKGKNITHAVAIELSTKYALEFSKNILEY